MSGSVYVERHDGVWFHLMPQHIMAVAPAFGGDGMPDPKHTAVEMVGGTVYIVKSSVADVVNQIIPRRS